MWRGKRGKGDKTIHPDGKMTFSGYRHYWKSTRLKSTAGKASASMSACAAEKSPLSCTCSPSAHKSLQLPAFCHSSFHLGLCTWGWSWWWGKEERAKHDHPSKPLLARKRCNKCVTLYLEGTQACHLLNEVGQDQACSIKRLVLKGEKAKDKAYCLAV